MGQGRASLSVVVPTRGRPSSVLRLVRSLLSQDGASGRLEILVVDNDPAATAEAALRGLGTAPGLSVLREGMPGLLAGRHRGAAAAAADLLAFLDDDVVAGPGWASAVLEEFARPATQLVTGPSRPVYEAVPPPWVEGFFAAHDGGRSCGHLSLLDLGAERRAVDPSLAWGLNLALRRSALEALGGFHPDALPWELRRYRGDGENGIALPARARGWKAVYAPDALVHHVIPAERLTAGHFCRRSHLQGISDSFHDIRARGGVGPLPRRVRAGRRRSLWLRAATLLGAGEGSVRSAAEAAYAEGYLFHRREAMADPALLAWVLRPDFRDGRLPEGWEGYLAGGGS